MRITHPHHPLYQRHVEIIRIRRGTDPDLIVRLPDGTHAAVAMSLTDYTGSTDPLAIDSPALLALAGLRQLVQLIDQWGQKPR